MTLLPAFQTAIRAAARTIASFNSSLVIGRCTGWRVMWVSTNSCRIINSRRGGPAAALDQQLIDIVMQRWLDQIIQA